MDADEIIVIENGRVADRGTHSSLLQNSESLYWKLWDTQNAGQLGGPRDLRKETTKETRHHTWCT